MVWKLVIEDDEGKRTTVPLTRDSYTIGRKEGNTIRLTERNVSRDHAKLSKQNGVAVPAPTTNGAAGYALEDCSSYNGVYVNGIRVAASQGLTHGDLIQIGDYRILIQDDAVEQPEIVPVVSGETPAAVSAPAQQAATRGSLMLERPNRLVMLAGPTPGMEYPLGNDRVTVGRAEDATISVNHNSVSRLHCEIHALSEGRYEIVDKGSSNGVRVNGSDLRRGIIEAGDIIELGDVRFKFVGAGQIFLPGVNDSQQLESISDRVADSALSRRSRGGIMPVLVSLFVVGGVLLVGIAVWKFKSKPSEPPPIASTNDDGTASVIAQAKALCAQGNCEAAHDKLLLGIPDGSPARQSADFIGLEGAWADMMLDRENNEPDPARKASILQMVIATPTVDAARRKIASDRLNALQTPTAMTSTVAPVPTPSDTTRLLATAPTPTHERPTPTETATHPRPTPTGAGGGSVADKARSLMLSDPNGAKNLLMPRVAAKKATPEEVTLLKAVCKSLKDYECVNMCKAQLGD